MNISQIKKLRRDICATTGHDLDDHTGHGSGNGYFWINTCRRCKKRIYVEFDKIAAAMSAPLKNSLDYRSIGRKLSIVEEHVRELPIYDKDLPDVPNKPEET